MHGYHDPVLARFDLRGVDGDLATILARPVDADDEATPSARRIIAEVRAGGDAALRTLTERFDGCRLDDLFVAASDVAGALDKVEPSVRVALEFARDQILAYHESQRGAPALHERSGVRIRELLVPVERAGLYVPGGRAAYPSTVLMTAIPALVAGVGEVALCVPPGPDGSVPVPTLAAAALVGVGEVYRVGGAQAIAALAYGTETIRPVDVIAGPGNAYVTAAKREVSGVVGIDALAGPSEVVVVADEASRAEFVAIDLLAQAEHGPGGAAVVVSWSEALLDAVDEELGRMVTGAPRRADIEATLTQGGRSVLVNSPIEAIEVANAIAPEHLELLVAGAEDLVPFVRNAGAVFCGPWAPAAVGDYVAGVNHVLPTARTARFASALRVDDFVKHIHVVSLDEEDLRRVSPHVAVLAEAEGLDAHRQSVTLRGEG